MNVVPADRSGLTDYEFHFSEQPDLSEELRMLRGHAGTIFGLAFTPDGKRLATASFDTLLAVGEIRLWDTELGKEVLTLPGHLAAVKSDALDGPHVFAASGDSEMVDGQPRPLDCTIRSTSRSLRLIENRLQQCTGHSLAWQTKVGLPGKTSS